jgi:hypothetical protein
MPPLTFTFHHDPFTALVHDNEDRDFDTFAGGKIKSQLSQSSLERRHPSLKQKSGLMMINEINWSYMYDHVQYGKNGMGFVVLVFIINI